MDEEGGKSLGKCHSINRSLLLAIHSLRRLQDVDCGFNLIIDRRRDRWTSVKTVLMKVSSYFPALIHVVYVLRPAGFFQKAISEVSTKFFKEEFRFRLVVCSSLEELNEFVPEHQLTADIGGSLSYSHHEWIQQMIVGTYNTVDPNYYGHLYFRFSELGKVLEHYAASVGESGPFHSHDLRDGVSEFGGGDTGSVGCAGQAV